MTRTTSLQALACALLLPNLLVAETRADDWRTRDQFTGDWGGLRSALAERGVAPYANYTTGFWSILHGGFGTATRYEGFASWGLDLDLDPLVGCRGGRFHIGWHSYHGAQPSTDPVGAFPTTAVSGWEGADSLRFYEIYFEQRSFDGRLRLKAGQIASDDDFFVAKHAGALRNATFGFLGLGGALQLGPFYPLAAPGVFLEVTPVEQWSLRGGVYTAFPGQDEPSNIGFDWSFDRGAFAVGELRTHRSPFGLPGTYSAGVVGVTSALRDFETGEDVHGAIGLYAVIDQALSVGAAGTPRLGAFVRGQFAAQPDRIPMHWYLDAGLELADPFPGREHDVLAFALAYLRVSDDFVSNSRSTGNSVTRHQLNLELTYRAQLTGWLQLQPSLQFFFDPTFSRHDAVVFGLSAVIDF